MAVSTATRSVVSVRAFRNIAQRDVRLRPLSKVIRISIAMDFYPDEYGDTELSPEEQLDYFKETFLDELAEGIMRNNITTDSVDVEVINE